ncbi:MAG: response regulator transcription factor [Rhodospirillales bacterium]
MHLGHVAFAVNSHPAIVHSLLYCLATEPAKTIRLFVVSGLRLLREGLSAGIQSRRHSDIAIVGCTGTSETETRIVADLEPDVVLIDLASIDGVAAAKTLRAQSPASKLVALSVADTEEAVWSCAAAGFSAFVTRDATIDDVLDTVLDACRGRMSCSPRIAAAMFSQLSALLRDGDPPVADPPLTVREQQILALITEGRSNKDIARELQISPSTVKNHIHNLLQKLKVGRRGQAAALARTDRRPPHSLHL